MSIAALRPPAAVYREEQYFSWWVYALLVLMVGLGLLLLGWAHPAAPKGAAPVGALHEVPAGLAFGLVLPAFLIVGVLRMTTEVTPGEVRVWFGLIATYRQSVPLAGVQRVEVVHYRPIADCWGWGVRTGRDGERVLNARGDRGVRIELSDGSRLLIGSQRPEALAAAIERALRPAG